MWASLMRRKAPRGNPEAAALKRWSVSEASSSKSRRTNATIAENAAKELESLAVHMPNVSDSEARAFALRMFYIEVSTPTDAQTNVSQMFHHYRTHLACVQRGTPIPWLHSLR